MLIPRNTNQRSSLYYIQSEASRNCFCKIYHLWGKGYFAGWYLITFDGTYISFWKKSFVFVVSVFHKIYLGFFRFDDWSIYNWMQLIVTQHFELMFPNLLWWIRLNSDIIPIFPIDSGISAEYFNIPHSNIHHSKIPHSYIPHFNIPHSYIPHSYIPHSKIPHSNISHSKIRHSNVPHSYIPHSNIPHSYIPHSNNPHSNIPHFKNSSQIPELLLNSLEIPEDDHESFFSNFWRLHSSLPPALEPLLTPRRYMYLLHTYRHIYRQHKDTVARRTQHLQVLHHRL